jgi:hypothetical protein
MKLNISYCNYIDILEGISVKKSYISQKLHILLSRVLVTIDGVWIGQ